MHLIWVSFTLLPMVVASFFIIAENILNSSQMVSGTRISQLVAPPVEKTELEPLIQRNGDYEELPQNDAPSDFSAQLKELLGKSLSP